MGIKERQNKVVLASLCQLPQQLYDEGTGEPIRKHVIPRRVGEGSERNRKDTKLPKDGDLVVVYSGATPSQRKEKQLENTGDP